MDYTDFSDINGYGDYDAGRDKLEKIFATVLGTEDALYQIHARIATRLESSVTII